MLPNRAPQYAENHRSLTGEGWSYGWAMAKRDAEQKPTTPTTGSSSATPRMGVSRM
ncbi:hypothetical protein KKF59_03560 [Patescibacteria group bacterium]|nr:hypothetical protein [Patescibacteria group bacterium]